eukprot:COSAG01_NODE_62510_length_284_cov_0.837838_1_plen_20_part_01
MTENPRTFLRTGMLNYDAEQ